MPALPFVPPELVGRRVVMLFSMWLDDAADPAGAELIDRLCSVGESLVQASTVLPFAAGVQHLIDEEFEDGHRYYTKEAHVAELADEAIDRLVDFWKDMPMEGEVEIIGLGGAIGDVAEDATAFSNRGYLLWLNFAMRWDDPDRDGESARHGHRQRPAVRVPTRLLAPLRWPRKVVCAGVNYRRHMQEMGGEIPAEGWRPFFFLKAPTTSVIGPHDPIVVRAPDGPATTGRPSWPRSSGSAAGTSRWPMPWPTWPATAWPTT